MNNCPNCGKVSGLHSSILQGCMCQYSMQAPTKRTWVGLTDEEIKELDLSNYVQVVRIVETKLKDKNL